METRRTKSGRRFLGELRWSLPRASEKAAAPSSPTSLKPSTQHRTDTPAVSMSDTPAAAKNPRVFFDIAINGNAAGR